MTTTDSLSRSARHASSNNAVMRLERINKNLLSLRAKLSSYMCEPKTLLLYQKLESIKQHLDHMQSNNKELIRRIQSKAVVADEGKTLAKQHFDLYKKLELKVLEYIGMAKLHC